MRSASRMLYYFLSVVAFVFANGVMAERDVLNFRDLEFLEPKPSGINSGAIFAVDGDPEQKIYVKTLYSGHPDNNSLFISYLTSRVLDLFVPGHGPHVVPVLGGKALMLATFEKKGFIDISPEYTENYVLLNLALDLMDISDRSSSNLGMAEIEGRMDAAVVDVDMYGRFKQNWLLQIDEVYCGKMKPQFKSALAMISSFSDQEVRDVVYAAVNELEKIMSIPEAEKYVAERHFASLDWLVQNVINRKDEMEWVLEHFESVCNVVASQSFSITEWLRYFAGMKVARYIEGTKQLTQTDFSDDKYGFFLRAAAHRNDIDTFKTLLTYGARDPHGWTKEFLLLLASDDFSSH